MPAVPGREIPAAAGCDGLPAAPAARRRAGMTPGTGAAGSGAHRTHPAHRPGDISDRAVKLSHKRRIPPAWVRLAAVAGPGLVVMLADTEAGSVVAAAQSGADWGYRLVLPQLLLTPALFMAQDLAGTLGLATGRGLVELVLRRFGRPAALVLLATIAVSCMGALVTELSGLAGVGRLFGVPEWQTSAAAATGLLAIVLTATYRSVERAAIAAGLCELSFIVLAALAHPSGADMARQVVSVPWTQHGYLYLLAANLGTCVIPWALVYQQSASIDKGLNQAHRAAVRIETLLGAALCQVITAAIVVAAAACCAGQPLGQVGDIARAFAAAIGPAAGRAVFAIGLSGGAIVAAIVVCLTAAWAFGEALGARRSLSESPAQAPWFYVAFAIVLGGGALLVGSGTNLVRLTVGAGVLNALLLPIMLAFLFVTARRELPPGMRPRGAYALLMALVLGTTACVGLYAGIVGAL